jgi:hypothetical protein
MEDKAAMEEIILILMGCGATSAMLKYFQL